MAKVFVGNFSFSVDDEQLKEYFSVIGPVISAKVMKEGQGGRSRGFGFVEFGTEEEAERAIKELEGSVWEGRVLKVSQDRSGRRLEQEGSSDKLTSNISQEGGVYQRSQSPMGYFRAQPLDLGIKRKKRIDPFEEDTTLSVNYKDPRLLSRFMSERGRILPRRMTGMSSKNQRAVTLAVKRAHQLSLLPMVKR